MNKLAVASASASEIEAVGEAVEVNRAAQDPWGDNEKHRAALERLFRRIGELSSLPAVAQRIILVADDPKSSAADLLGVVQGDPAMAVRILRRVNSAYYGLKHRVVDLQSAISMLGMRELRNLALTVYVAKMFESPGDYRGYSREGLWNHSVAVAVASRLVMEICTREDPNEAYVSGLLHDIGYILIDQRLRHHFCSVLDELTGGAPATDIERRLLTFDHAELGAYVARAWRFPAQVIDAIGYHHSPEIYAGDHAATVYAVSLANHLCSRAGFTSLGVANIACPGDKVLAGLGLRRDKLSKIVDRLEPALHQASFLAEAK